MGKPSYADTCNNNCTYLAEKDARIKELEELHDSARTLVRATSEVDGSIQVEALLVPIPEYDAFLEALAALAGKETKRV